MLALLLALSLQPATQPADVGFSPHELWAVWAEERFVTTPAPCLRHAELMALLADLRADHPDQARLQTVGTSFQGRLIQMLTIGRGDDRVLLWSQMHGDEPSATPALLDLASYLLRHADEPTVRAILDQLTLLIVPMLNPDGTEVYQRRNAQGIDINRDALSLSTPEGRTLKRVRDMYEPILGFNLHDQSRRKTVGDSGVLATNAVLAVSGDAEGTVTPGRLRAKRACAAIATTLAPFAPGGMARYNEDWSPRAFGDNVTAWGTPVVLIESGGLLPDRDLTELTRLNFVALLTVLDDLVENDLEDHDPQIYEDLLRNQESSWADVVARGGSLLQPAAPRPYRADLAFIVERGDLALAGCPMDTPATSRVTEIGDARFIGASHEIDAAEKLLTAPFAVELVGWEHRDRIHTGGLEAISRLGVGHLRWRVDEAHRLAAEELAGQSARPGLPAVEVVTSASDAGWLTLAGWPQAADPSSLSATLEALGGDTWRQAAAGLDPLDALGLLWPTPETDRGRWPVLRRGRPASFLVMTAPPDGELDLESIRLESVWLDGIETGRSDAADSEKEGMRK